MLTEKHSFEHRCCTEDLPCCRSAISTGKSLCYSSKFPQTCIAARIDLPVVYRRMNLRPPIDSESQAPMRWLVSWKPKDD